MSDFSRQYREEEEAKKIEKHEIDFRNEKIELDHLKDELRNIENENRKFSGKVGEKLNYEEIFQQKRSTLC